MGPDCNVGVVARPLLGVVDAAETLVEEVIETLMDVVSLAHDYRVTLDGRVADCSDGVDLGGGEINVTLRAPVVYIAIISSQAFTEGTSATYTL